MLPERDPAIHPTSDRSSASDENALDAELADGDALFGDLFAQIAEPPADLEIRASRSASAGLRDRSVFGVAVDLLGVGVEALRLMFCDPAREERR